MFYTIYKTTNKLNGKIYIGKHQTKDLDDDYMGSGRSFNDAIQKYGIENFSKEILHIFDNEQEMNAKEAQLVTKEFVREDTNYNLCPGGTGGWGYINSNEELRIAKNRKAAAISNRNGNAYKIHIDNVVIPKYEKMPKLCACCKIAIPYERKKNKYCSRSCAAKVNNVKYPKRTAK